MKIKIINQHYDGAYYTVTYSYHQEGDCACKAVKVKRTFTQMPTTDDLILAI